MRLALFFETTSSCDIAVRQISCSVLQVGFLYIITDHAITCDDDDDDDGACSLWF